MNILSDLLIYLEYEDLGGFWFRNTKNPAVLVECGFVSNYSERKNMMKGSWRQKIAEGIGNGIIKYQSGRKKGTYY